jgi:hypothetical protein
MVATSLATSVAVVENLADEAPPTMATAAAEAFF